MKWPLCITAFFYFLHSFTCREMKIKFKKNTERIEHCMDYVKTFFFHSTALLGTVFI